MLAEAQIKDINGTVLLTPEEIREALDSGTLDEESVDPTCLTGENGLLQWLWEFFFGKDEEETPQYSGWRTENGKTYYYDQNTHQLSPASRASTTSSIILMPPACSSPPPSASMFPSIRAVSIGTR